MNPKLQDLGGNIIKKENEILELHSKNINSKDIAIQLDVSKSTVMRVLRKYNLKSNNNKPLNPRLFTEDEIKLMVELYNDGLTCPEIYEGFFKNKCSCFSTIQGLLSRRIGLRKVGKRIDFDEDFFENINSERKAYWLGFIYADGNVTNNRLRIEIKKEDEYLLEELNKDLGSKNKICEDKRTHEYNGYIINKNNVYIGYCSDKLVSDLNKLGVIENKTFKLNYLPEINNELLAHFIRGYFDGDGTVYNSNKKYSDNRSIFGFYGQHQLLDKIKKLLIKEIGLSDIKIFDKKTVSQVTFSKQEDILRFYNYIYKDATIYLIRKKEKFDKYIK